MKKVVLKAISALLVFAIVVSCGALSFAAQTPTDIPHTFITSDGQYGECEVVVQDTPILRLLITLFGWLDHIVKLIFYPIMPLTII